jgi:hypothetical protein
LWHPYIKSNATHQLILGYVHVNPYTGFTGSSGVDRR